MSVASRNAFALLGDEDSAPVAAPAVKKEAAATANAAPKRSIPGLNANNRNGASRNADNGRPAGRSGGEDGAADGPQQRDSRSSRGGARGARGGERGGRGRGAPRGGRRQFDRHSQTGKEDSHKKVEQGWGGDDPKRELDAEDGAKADAEAEETAEKKEDGAPAVNGSAEKELAPVVEEEKDNTKTLDEYLAEQAAKRAQIGTLKEARAAEVDSKTLGTKVTKQEGDDYYSSQKERKERQRERKEKQTLEIEQNFYSAPAAGRGRGGEGRGGRGGNRGRGEGRGRGGRGEFRGSRGGRGRGGNSAGANINLSDSSAFPTLA